MATPQKQVPSTSPYSRPVYKWLDRLVPLGLAGFMMTVFFDYTYWMLRSPKHIASWQSLIFFSIWIPTTLFYVILAVRDIAQNWNGQWEFAGPKARNPLADTVGRDKLGLQDEFFRSPTGKSYDITQNQFFRWLFHRRWYQFAMQLPNVIIFNIVIIAGLIGIVNPNLNFATVITWYVWFGVLFVLMIGVGRAWCLICPFSAQAEWVQRLGLFGKGKKLLTFGFKWPAKYSTVLISVFFFLGLTWSEEFYNVAGPGKPIFTSLLVAGIILWDLFYALLFERRSFCHYGCPLAGVIGVVSAVAPFEGFRAKDKTLCKTCTTKECMKGSNRSYGCGWYEYPGSMTSNFNCGLTGECFKGCPYENIGLSVHPPLQEAYQPRKKRFDLGLSVTIMMGALFFEIINATPQFAAFDTWLTKATGWNVVAKALTSQLTGYPNPIDYLGIIAMLPLLGWMVARLGQRLTNNVVKTREIFTRYSYGWIPLFGLGILARQLPKVLTNGPTIVQVISDPFGFGWNMLGTAHLHLAARSFAPMWILWVQIGFVLLGTAASLFVTTKITQLDFFGRPGAARLQVLNSLVIVLLAVAMVGLYYYIALINPGHPLSPPF